VNHVFQNKGARPGYIAMKEEKREWPKVETKPEVLYGF
jgi:hypothetical protein